jgi:two-component system response regulator PrrA
MDSASTLPRVLSARSSVDFAGQELGADDYLVKPLRLARPVARVDALLRRRGTGASLSSETITVDRLEMDLPARHASLNGSEVNMLPTARGVGFVLRAQ